MTVGDGHIFSTYKRMPYARSRRAFRRRLETLRAPCAFGFVSVVARSREAREGHARSSTSEWFMRAPSCRRNPAIPLSDPSGDRKRRPPPQVTTAQSPLPADAATQHSDAGQRQPRPWPAAARRTRVVPRRLRSPPAPPAPRDALAAAVLERFPNLRLVASTVRTVHMASVNDGSAVATARNAATVVSTQSERLEILDRVGGGDGFVAGLIYGLLAGGGQPFPSLISRQARSVE